MINTNTVEILPARFKNAKFQTKCSSNSHLPDLPDTPSEDQLSKLISYDNTKRSFSLIGKKTASHFFLTEDKRMFPIMKKDPFREFKELDRTDEKKRALSQKNTISKDALISHNETVDTDLVRMTTGAYRVHKQKYSAPLLAKPSTTFEHQYKFDASQINSTFISSRGPNIKSIVKSSNTSKTIHLEALRNHGEQCRRTSTNALSLKTLEQLKEVDSDNYIETVEDSQNENSMDLTTNPSSRLTTDMDDHSVDIGLDCQLDDISKFVPPNSSKNDISSFCKKDFGGGETKIENQQFRKAAMISDRPDHQVKLVKQFSESEYAINMQNYNETDDLNVIYFL